MTEIERRGNGSEGVLQQTCLLVTHTDFALRGVAVDAPKKLK